MCRHIKTFWIWLYFQMIGVWKILQEQIWDRHRHVTVSQNSSIYGKTIVITGGNRGIGFEAVMKLLPLGCHIIIGCRRPSEAFQVIEKSIKSPIYSDKYAGQLGTYECIQLNLASMKSVKNFVSELIKRACDINILINNAGVMFGPYELTEDGLENQMATNYFGHFLLTDLLLPILTASAEKSQSNSRVINVASCAHFAGSWLDLQDLNASNYYSAYESYANSKAAQIMFTKYLSQKLHTEECTNVDVNCIHPGVVNTGLFQHVGWAQWFSCLPMIFFKTPKQGGESIVYAATSPDIEGIGGLYLDNSRAARSSSFVNNIGNQAALWQKTCEILKTINEEYTVV